MTVTQSGDQLREAELALFKSSSIETAEGLEIQLWASDSLAPDPVALSIDDFGRVYITRTNRQENSEFDIRGYRHWMTPSISMQSVEDRRAFLKETFAPEKSKENEWFPDLNEDGNHDWRDLTVEKDEIWRLEDRDSDGFADISTRIVNDFHEEISDVAGALLVRREDMFVGVSPDMWRLEDTNGDGIPDKKESISYGYGVHIGFGAHGMSGVIEGPDGKLYWGIGDLGANITTKEGAHHKYPNQGIIVRCNPDGSDFEVFARGLRNTHEFAFDAYGNLIGADNDGDHRGESERLVHIVEGSDAGWRINWQFGKYTDPRNNRYKVWMDEKLSVPRWDGQAAYIIPPIQNFHNGPTGMIFNPGTALGSSWVNKFFLVEFTGTAARSPIWAFSLKPEGASFVLDEEQEVLKGILPTGIRFGPDGALYAADWVMGWGTKNYGRVWRVDVPAKRNDFAELRARTQELMTLDFDEADLKALEEYLGFQDLRIRKKAQFELVARGEDGAGVLKKAVQPSDNQFKRIHAIWGLGQLVAQGAAYGETIETLLHDEDAEIVAQAAKVLGDVRYQPAADALTELIESADPRVQFFAAQAVGRLAYQGATTSLIEMIKNNGDRDVYLRHAAVLALSRIGNANLMVTLKDSNNRSLRIAAVLVLRRMGHPGLEAYLRDQDEYIVAEAARAIHDDWSVPAAMPGLAMMLEDIQTNSEVIVRRVLSACQRLGDPKYLELVLEYAQREDISMELKAEALAIVGTWASPSVLDRVDGRLRGAITRDRAAVIQAVEPAILSMLKSSDEALLIATGNMIMHLGMQQYSGQLATLFEKSKTAPLRASLLTNLRELDYAEMDHIIKEGLIDSDEDVRSTALSMLDKLGLSAEGLLDIASPLLESGSVREQQELVSVLASMPIENTADILEDLVGRWKQDRLPAEVRLELLEAIDSSGSLDLQTAVASLRGSGTVMDEYAETLVGGSRRRGYRLFSQHATAQCTRCHSIADNTHELETVGPPLHNIGDKLTREQLLEALIDPSARISPGYGVVMLTLTDESVVTGTLLEERESELVLKINNPEPIRIQKERVEKRENLPSSMPGVTTFLSKREVRDLVEFLANLTGDPM